MVCNLLKSSSFLDLTQGHLNIKIKIMVFSEITGPMKVKFYVEPPCLGETKVCAHMQSVSNAQHGHCAHKCSKIFFSRTGGWIFKKLSVKHQGP